MDIAQGAIGTKGSYEVDFTGGKFIAKAEASPVDGVKAGASIEIDEVIVIEALAAKIGGVAPALAKLLEAALSSISK